MGWVFWLFTTGWATTRFIPNIHFFSFNFPTSHTGSTATNTVAYTHLANQHYDICIRRASGYCYICYTAQDPAPTAMQTFSVS